MQSYAANTIGMQRSNPYFQNTHKDEGGYVDSIKVLNVISLHNVCSSYVKYENKGPLPYIEKENLREPGTEIRKILVQICNTGLGNEI